MAQIIVRNLDDTLLERLRAKARDKGQSLEQTVREILREAALPSRQELIRDARRIRAMMPPSSIDSTELIRQDRDNDEPHR